MARKELKENELTEDDRLNYQVLVGDIRESKADQWRISNYGLLAQAAVASLSHSGFDAILWKSGLSILSVLICIIVIRFIEESWARIKKCRLTTEQYPLPYNDQLNPSPSRDWPILRLFRGAQVIGSIMSIFYIFSVT